MPPNTPPKPWRVITTDGRELLFDVVTRTVELPSSKPITVQDVTSRTAAADGSRPVLSGAPGATRTKVIALAMYHLGAEVFEVLEPGQISREELATMYEADIKAKQAAVLQHCLNALMFLKGEGIELLVARVERGRRTPLAPALASQVRETITAIGGATCDAAATLILAGPKPAEPSGEKPS